jgi:hypothetical protein
MDLTGTHRAQYFLDDNDGVHKKNPRYMVPNAPRK